MLSEGGEIIIPLVGYFPCNKPRPGFKPGESHGSIIIGTKGNSRNGKVVLQDVSLSLWLSIFFLFEIQCTCELCSHICIWLGIFERFMLETLRTQVQSSHHHKSALNNALIREGRREKWKEGKK